MKIDKITYQKTYSIGPYLTDRVGFEATVDEYENISDALDMLQKEADDWHKEANPHLYQDTKDWKPGTDLPTHLKTQVTFTPTPEINIQHERIDPEDTLALIQNAPSLEVLTTFKLLAGKDKVWYSAYNKRLKELTNGK